MAITFWRNVQRKITTQEMDASFDTLVNDIANAGLSDEMPEGTIYIGDNTNVASLETLDTSIVPSVLDKRYVTDANLTVIGNTSGTNTGDNATNTTSNAYADGKVADAITDGVTTIAPSQNAVFDALALKQNSLGYTAENSANKTDTVTGNEASSTKYLSVKGVYDWATGLFATISNLALKSNIASPTFTGTVTTPDINISGATASTIAHFDASKNVESLPTATYPNLTELSYVKGVTSAIQSQLNAKLGVSGGTLTGALNEATIVTVASATNVDIVNIASNTAYITGTTGISTFTAGTSGMIRRLYFAGALVLHGGNNVKLPNAAATLTTTANDVGTFVYNATDSKWYCVSYTRGSVSSLTADRLTYFNGTDIVTGEVRYLSSGAEIRLVNDGYLSYGSTTGNNYIRGGSSLGLELKAVNNAITLNFNDTSRLLVQPSEIQLTGPAIVFRNYDASVYYGHWTSGGLLIGSYGTINSRAILQVDSTTKGFLPPRMTNAQRTAITSPAIGLMVYCTDATEGLYIYKSTGWTFII